VFDAPGLAFDPATGAFTVRPAAGGTPVAVVAPEPEASLVARLLTREGWAVGELGGAVVTRTGPGRFPASGGEGTTAEGMGWAELASWARGAGKPPARDGAA
jgi:iron complex transport system ATP-binding protein